MLKNAKVNLVFNYVPFSGIEIKKFRELLSKKHGCDLFLLSKKDINNLDSVNIGLYQTWIISMEVKYLSSFFINYNKFNVLLKGKGLVPLCVWDSGGAYSYNKFIKLLPKMSVGPFIPVVLTGFVLRLAGICLKGVHVSLGVLRLIRYNNFKD